MTRLVNVRYLTGFTGSNAALLVGDRGAVLCTDGRYLTQAAEEAPGLELLVDRECPPALVSRAGRDGIRRLAFEAHDVSVEAHAELRGLDGAPELVPLGHAVEELRTVKDDGELALLREACAIGDRALRETLERTAPGQTEREVARRLEACMLELGAEGVAFETIVATGPNSAIPHHQPHRPRARAAATCSRSTSARGTAATTPTAPAPSSSAATPADWQREIYDVVRRGAAGRPARPRGRAPTCARSTPRPATSWSRPATATQFPHGLGHGVGLEIHEAPMLGVRATGRLAGRTPVTVEPGVYLPGRGGVRIEDTLVVGDGDAGAADDDLEGPAGPLTPYPKELRVATTNDLKNGLVLNLDGQLWSVVEFQHVKPGKGGAFVRTKLKNVLSGKVVDKTFNAGTKVETATVDKRDMQYLYKDGDGLRLHGHRSLRPDPRAGRDGRRRWPSTCWRTRTPSSPMHEGTPLYVELPPRSS